MEKVKLANQKAKPGPERPVACRGGWRGSPPDAEVIGNHRRPLHVEGITDYDGRVHSVLLHDGRGLRQVLLSGSGMLLDQDVFDIDSLLNRDRLPNAAFGILLPLSIPTGENDFRSIALLMKIDPVPNALRINRRWIGYSNSRSKNDDAVGLNRLIPVSEAPYVR